MQTHTHYISIDLGIGGWQPYDAQYVHERGYGDCKALSNYMITLLKEAGIIAYPVLIQNGSNPLPLVNEFPSNQFNHVIVCVPIMPDSVWLECTSQTMLFNCIGRYNENRSALMVTPEGGIVVRTPQTISKQNIQRRHATITLNSFGYADVTVAVYWKGDQQDQVRSELDEATPEEHERWIMHSLDIPNINIKSYKFEGVDTQDSAITLSLDLSLPRYASVTGKRIFFQPNAMERRTFVPPDVSVRLSPIKFTYPYYDVDSLYYSIPSQYSAESIPPDVFLVSSFGTFRSKTIALGDSAIIYTRSLEIRDYTIPAKNYAEYRKFFADIVKADRAQVVLVRKK